MFKQKRTIIVIIILLIALFVVLWLVFIKNKNTGSQTSGSKYQLVDCTNTASTEPSALTGWKTSLYAAPLANDSSNTNTPDNGVRVFSISQIKAKTSPNSIYYRVEKSDGGYIAGTKSVMEVCSSDNKAIKYYTTNTDTSDGADSNVSAEVHYLHGGNYITDTTGQYRIDGYVYVGGSWHFTNRMTGVTLEN